MKPQHFYARTVQTTAVKLIPSLNQHKHKLSVPGAKPRMCVRVDGLQQPRELANGKCVCVLASSIKQPKGKGKDVKENGEKSKVKDPNDDLLLVYHDITSISAEMVAPKAAAAEPPLASETASAAAPEGTVPAYHAHTSSYLHSLVGLQAVTRLDTPNPPLRSRPPHVPIRIGDHHEHDKQKCGGEW